MLSEVTPLKHELGDHALASSCQQPQPQSGSRALHTVEATALVAEAGSAGAELAKVLGRLWDGLVVELENDLAERLAVGRNVEKAV